MFQSPKMLKYQLKFIFRSQIAMVHSFSPDPHRLKPRRAELATGNSSNSERKVPEETHRSTRDLRKNGMMWMSWGDRGILWWFYGILWDLMVMYWDFIGLYGGLIGFCGIWWWFNGISWDFMVNWMGFWKPWKTKDILTFNGISWDWWFSKIWWNYHGIWPK